MFHYSFINRIEAVMTLATLNQLAEQLAINSPNDLTLPDITKTIVGSHWQTVASNHPPFFCSTDLISTEWSLVNLTEMTTVEVGRY